MRTFFAETKRTVAKVLTSYLAREQKRLRKVNWFAADAVNKLIPFVIGGKMLRGGFTVLGYNLAGKKFNRDIVHLAAAVELIHSSLVVHDDIMDQDDLRRGNLTIPAQYAKLSRSRGANLPQHTGESLAVCVGDLGFFIATQLLTEVKFSGASRKVIRLVGDIIAEVCLAQMQDVWWGRSGEEPSPSDILKMYRYKTGRYTFCLPLLMGATAGGASPATLGQVEKLGECLGLMFQIKDDEIGIFGDEKITGKPVGSDIKENKKTIWRSLLWQKSSVGERRLLKAIFGAKLVTQNGITYVRRLINNLGIHADISKRQKQYASQAVRIIDNLRAPKKNKEILYELVEYNLKREA
ncbi:MAG: polyprenyl synthetase family protein [Candidatus Magasanikbacteria bacterium]|nr:polyprenyl synthetase family protein [Candidatus Magasanikbacteria bacterium]